MSVHFSAEAYSEPFQKVKMERKIIQLFSQNAQGFEYDCVKYAVSKPEISA